MPLAGPAVPSGARGQAAIGRGRAEEQSGYEDAVRGAERQESKEVGNKERDEEKVKASAAQPSQPGLHMGVFLNFFGIMATSDLSSLIPTPFNMRLLPN